MAHDAPPVGLLSFEIARQTFCFPISSVREIRSWSAVTPIPNSEEYVLGLTNLRGRITPVIDLQRRLGFGCAAVGERSVVVIVEDGPRIVGFLVDAVRETLSVEQRALQWPDALVGDIQNFVQAVIDHDGELLSLLAIEEVVFQRPPAPQVADELV